MLQDRSKFAEEKAAKHQIAEPNQAGGQVLAKLRACGSMCVAVANEVLVIGEQRGQHQCGFLGEYGGEIAPGYENVAAQAEERFANVDKESGNKQKCCLEIRHPGDQRHGLCVDRMYSKQEGRDSGVG